MTLLPRVLILCLAWLAPAVFAGADAAGEQLVALKATITVKNAGDLPLDSYIQRLTIPANDHAQQQLLRIEYPYPDQYTLRPHDNGVDHYMKFKWDVPPRSQLSRAITFHLRLTPFDHTQTSIRKSDSGGNAFLTPSRFVESEAGEVLAIARTIRHTYSSPERQLFAAFQYPQRNLRYTTLDNKGALYALKHGSGDCTEYAALFVAIARALGIPARMTSEFNFSKDRSFDAPNHHAAEAYLDGAWIPVDPNLALDPSLGYGFGHGTASKVVLQRGDSWTWSNSIPKTSKTYRDRNIEVTLRWTISSAQ